MKKIIFAISAACAFAGAGQTTLVTFTFTGVSSYGAAAYTVTDPDAWGGTQQQSFTDQVSGTFTIDTFLLGVAGR